MKIQTSALLLLSLSLVPATTEAKIQVVATLPDLAAIALAVGGAEIEVTSLASPNQDPHYVDPRPSFMLALNRADLLVLNGLELEAGWLGRLIVSSRNARIQLGAPGYLDASLFVERLQITTGPIDRAMGDIHPGGNPHFLFDPRRVRSIARAIADRLASIDREHAPDYQRRQQAFDRALAELAESQAARFAALPKTSRQIVAYHQSLIYLVDWLGLEQVATIEPRPGIAPEPGHVASVLRLMRETKTGVIVQESFYQRGPSETLAKLAKAKLHVIAGGTDLSSGQTYLERIALLTGGLYDVLANR